MKNILVNAFKVAFYKTIILIFLVVCAVYLFLNSNYWFPCIKMNTYLLDQSKRDSLIISTDYIKANFSPYYIEQNFGLFSQKNLNRLTILKLNKFIDTQSIVNLFGNNRDIFIHPIIYSGKVESNTKWNEIEYLAIGGLPTHSFVISVGNGEQYSVSDIPKYSFSWFESVFVMCISRQDYANIPLRIYE